MQLVERFLIQIPNPSVILATLLIFMTSAYAIISGIYLNTLFLTSYPLSWLIYFLVTLAFFTAFFGLVLTPLFTKNIKENCLFLVKIFLFIMLMLVALRSLNYYWLPFVISIVLGTMSALISVIAWSIIPLAFNIREYKKVARLAGFSSSAGSIVGSFLIPLQLRFLPLDSLLYLLGLLSLTMGLNIYLLPLLKEKISYKVSEQKNPFRYPLFQTVLFFLICIIATQCLIDYIFKFEAAKHYSGGELGSFFGMFSGITSVIGLILGMTSLKYIIKYFSLDGILYATPLFTFIACLGVIMMPSLWTICLLASIRALFYFNYTTLSTEIALNILPSIVRAKAKFQLKTIFSPFATLIVLFLLMILAKKVGIFSITVVIAAISLFCLFLVKKVTHSYKTTLQAATEFKRFNVLDQFGDANIALLQQIIENSLASNDSNIVLLGLSLIDSSNTSKLPNTIYTQLNHPNILVRKSIINLIRVFKATESLDLLTNQFAVESDIEVKFLILNTLSILNPEITLNIAREIIKNPLDLLYPAAINVLIECGNLSEKTYANNVLHTLIHHENALARKEAVRIIGRLSLIDYQAELNQLIADEDHDVSCEAISAAAKCNLVSLTPQILSQLRHRSRASTIYKAIAKLGVQTIPYLISEIAVANNPTLLIKALNSIPGDEKDAAILAIMKTDKVFLRNIIAKDVNAKACLTPPSKALRKCASELALEETFYLASLTNMSLHHTSIFLLAEIQSRQQLAKKNILYWLAVATDPIKINQLIPSLMHSTQDVSFAQAQAKAMELLEIYIKDKALLTRVINIFEPDDKSVSIAPAECNDAWLTRIINAELNKGEDMDLLSKVFDLRGVEIFKDLPAEILIAIAEETERLSYEEGESVFLENDPPNGLYCVSSGEVRIERQGKVLNILKEHDYFGELALIDDSFRTADAYIQSDASLLFLSKETFDRITDDLPEVLRTVAKVILKYLRQR